MLVEEFAKPYGYELQVVYSTVLKRHFQTSTAAFEAIDISWINRLGHFLNYY